VAKQVSLEQAVKKQAAAIRFAENVLQDDSKADELSDLSPQEYAERRGLEVVDNPRRRANMVNSSMSKDELLDRIDELESENSDLQDALDSIADIASPAPGDDDDSDDDDQA
jgi:hypothetical protein